MPASTIAPADFAVLCDVIRAVARSSRLPKEDADDFSQHVHLRLLERDYAPVTVFAGRCALRAFLSVVVRRLLLDWRNSRFGKWRPSAAAIRLGDVAVMLDRLIHRDGHSDEEAISVLDGQLPELSVPVLRELLVKLPRRAKVRVVVPEDMEGVAANQFVDPVELEQAEDERRRAMATLRHAYARLPVADRRLLYLRFQEGLEISAIAVLFDVPAKPLYGRVKRLLRTLRQSIVANHPEMVTATRDEHRPRST
jgi:RNA polymerase sigma factor (sigma-70 family)